MPVLYKIYRDNRPDSSNLYYGRAVQINSIETEGLADIIQRNCSMKKSDVLAVLTELVEVMTDQLQNSMVVRLNGFGSFRVGLRTRGAEKPEEFSIARNVLGLHVNFLPEGKKDIATNKVTRKFLGGATLQKYDPTPVANASAPSTPSEPKE